MRLRHTTFPVPPVPPVPPFIYSVGYSFIFFWYLLALHKCKLFHMEHLCNPDSGFRQSGNRAIGQSVCCGGIAASTGIRIQRAIGKVCCGGIAASTGSTGSVAFPRFNGFNGFNGFKIVKDS